MNDLFDAAVPEGPRPLADAMRPRSLDEVVGQDKLLAAGSILRRRVAARRLGSIILYGPPGVGKTSIARAIGAEIGKEFRPLHATRAGVADLRRLADEARMKPLLIFVDEVHRFSATQADDLLAICEDGTADFVGATTQNPYHALSPALVSRSTILQLEAITIGHMMMILHRACEAIGGLGTRIRISDDHLRLVAGRSGGDARRALTALESMSVGHQGSDIEITLTMIDEVFAAAPVNHDRGGDQHYDVVSGFVKSMRGSDPDATLYWLARLIHAGEDPRYIARRIMIHASEDVGLADNTALQTAVAALHAVEKIGYPEAQIILAHAALHVARSPKSSSSIRGIQSALEYVRKEPPLAVPAWLRDAHYKGASALGAEGYLYPHADPRGWVEQDYAPGIRRGAFYQSDARSGTTFEGRADAFWEGLTGVATPAVFR